MKKYITIAALLAAGSALANAETITFSTTPEYNGSEGGSYAGIVFTLAAYDSLRFSASEELAADVDVLLKSITLQERGNNDLAEGRILYITDVNNVYLGASGVFSKATGDDECVFVFDDLQLDSTATYYAYLATSDSVNNWTAGGTVVPSGQYYSGQLAAAGGSLTQATASNWGFLNGQKSLASTGFVPVMDIVVAPIPEPSTFGLLAGLGALALVGTRRRRK